MKKSSARGVGKVLEQNGERMRWKMGVEEAKIVQKLALSTQLFLLSKAGEQSIG